MHQPKEEKVEESDSSSDEYVFAVDSDDEKRVTGRRIHEDDEMVNKKEKKAAKASSTAAPSALAGLKLDDDAVTTSDDGTVTIDGKKTSGTPLLVFINRRSGGQQGVALIAQFKKLLHSAQIFDLAEGGPAPGLEAFRHVPNTRLLICGGDGTAGWVFMTMDKLGFETALPAAILPLGTGNDLARSLKWGPGYNGGKLLPILEALKTARQAALDRWSIDILPTEETEAPEAAPRNFILNNYFSIGIDASVALKFHEQREAHPEKFTSRNMNKIRYTLAGTASIFENKTLHKIMTLEVDGKEVALPSNIEGIVVLNLDSYAGGTNLWGSKKGKWQLQAPHDGLFEVVGVTGSIHLGAIKTHLASAKRLAQGSAITINLKEAAPVQVDGEPWAQPPAVIKIKLHTPTQVLIKTKGEKVSKTAEVVVASSDDMTKVHTAHEDKSSIKHLIHLKEGKKDESSPLLVFINKKSGGQQGISLMAKLRELLSPDQVFDLSEGGPEPGLKAFKDIPNTRILVCGGDGTAGWVLNAIHSMGMENHPPVAVLPLGTGNDLSRSLKWGPGYSGEKLAPILKAVGNAEEIMMDRWSVVVSTKNESGTYEAPVGKCTMNNYFSFGIDALVTLEFHLAREAHPENFKSRNFNKIRYAVNGGKELFHHHQHLHKELEVEVDGKLLDLSSDLEGIVVLNLNSYAAGTNLWGHPKSQKFQPYSCNDGLFEVVGITGSFHLGAIKSHLASAKRLAQGKHIKMTLHSSEMAAQVDGEPWKQPPAVVEIKHLTKARMLTGAKQSEPKCK